MEELKNYIYEQIQIAKVYKGNKSIVVIFQERAFGAARFYDQINNTKQGMKIFEKNLDKFENLY